MMIYPWMLGVLQTESSVLGSARATDARIDKSYPYPFPRVDMAIKFFSPFNIPTISNVTKDNSPRTADIMDILF